MIEITLGVAQGSILGTVLWNASYGYLLRLNMPEGGPLVDYDDDVMALIFGSTVE